MSTNNPDSKFSTPPTWAAKLLVWFADPNTREEVQGDLLEMHAHWKETIGARKAKWRYIFSVIKLLRPFAKEKRSEDYPKTYLFGHDMIRNYFKIAFRNLVKNKGYSAINIGGLAVGMAVAILIGLWLYDEFSFNKYHENYESIAQVRTRLVSNADIYVNNSMQYPLGTELKTNYKGNFKNIVMASGNVDNILSAEGKNMSRKGHYMEANAPEMLTLKMLHGSRSGLKDPHSIMLSASTANALYGDVDPIDKIMKINNKTAVKVTGVYEDLPLNTEFADLKFLSTFDLWVEDNPWIAKSAMDDWENHFLKIYVQINPNTAFEKVSANIKDAELKNLGNLKEQAKLNPQIFLAPMSTWHLNRYERGLPDNSNIQMIWQIGIIGAFVLLLACINFMNLSTARFEKRAKEVGVRKSVGSLQRQLVGQFLSESFLVVILAFVLALFLAAISLPEFNNRALKQIAVPWTNPYFWISALCFILITGLLAGSYPAFYLSSFQPVKVLKGIGSSRFSLGRFASVPRKVLVVLQFTVSVTLIVGTVIVYRQIQLAKTRPIGYSRAGLLMIEKKSADFYGKYDLLRNELKNTGAVVGMSESMGKVTELTSGNVGFEWKGKASDPKAQFGTLAVTTEYGKTVGWDFVKGRDFSREFTSDSSGMVINESAAKYFGFKNPIGEDVRWKFQDHEIKSFKILGVVKDMLMESPYEPVYPTLFMIKAHGGTNFINIRLNPNLSANVALPKVEAVFHKLIPSAPFEYTFADEDYAQKFTTEERAGTIAGFFACIAIIISCLGLFGLASFTAEQRTKEIGIRKVLGASVANLWQMLSKDFVVLVVISTIIAIPVSSYAMQQWLEKYTYKTEMSWWIFALTSAGALSITLLTVSYQAIKAAMINPVKSLRSE